MRQRNVLTIGMGLLISVLMADAASAYYSPHLGRFLNRDPINEPGHVLVKTHRQPTSFVPRDPISSNDDLNEYRFVKNSPINYIDPSGLSTLSEAIDRLNKAGTPVTQQSAFDEWYRHEKTLGAWWAQLPKCPCSLKCPAVRGIHNPDPKKWDDPKKPSTAEEALHPGITWTMRSKAVGGHHNQCTYDKAGNLITVPPAAGTVDYKKPATLSHVRHDVDAVVSANVLDGGKHVKWWWPWPNKMSKPIGANVKKYYEVRPTWSYDCPHNDI